MRTTIRKAGVVCGTALASLAIALSAAAGAGASNSAVVIGGIGAGSMSDMLMAPLLGGKLQGQERVNVNWPAVAGPMTGSRDMTLGASIDIGVTNLTAAINTALGKLSRDGDGHVINGEKVTVVGLSAGSLVVNEVLRNMIAAGDLTDPDEISFIVVEDSSRQELIKDTKYNSRLDYTYQPAPVTPYDVVVVTGEYDGMADMPDRPRNLLAVANAMVGSVLVHVPVMYSNLSKVPEENITVSENTEGGTTTHYLVPTKVLPLVQVMPFLKFREAELKAKIDKGYSRNDPVTSTAGANTVVAVEPPAESSTVPADTDADSPRTVAAAKREAKREARGEAAAARREARAEAKADAAATRQAKREARAAAARDRNADDSQDSGDSASSNGSGSSDSSGSSE